MFLYVFVSTDMCIYIHVLCCYIYYLSNIGTMVKSKVINSYIL